MQVDEKKIARERRHDRIRKSIEGTAQRPRVSVFRSARHIYAQIIDDDKGLTLASASTLDPEVRAELNGDKKDSATRVGNLLAKRATAKGVRQVVFDRGGYQYHGRVKALADAAREGGLEF